MKSNHWKLAGTIIRWAPAALYAIPGAMRTLEYDRVKVMSGQAWRMITCQWTHWSVDHLLWDALAFVVLGVLCERMNRRKYWITLALSAILIPLAVWVWIPGLRTFRGLSGIDSALFALLAVMVTRAKIAQRAWRRVAGIGVIAGLFFGKIIYEVVTGDTVFVDSAGAGMVPVPLAHVVGAMIGIVVGMRRFSIADFAVRLHHPNDVPRLVLQPCVSLDGVGDPVTASATPSTEEARLEYQPWHSDQQIRDDGIG